MTKRNTSKQSGLQGMLPTILIALVAVGAVVALVLTSTQQPAAATACDFPPLDPNDPSIVRTGSGLGYVQVREGTGARPNANSRVRVHYEGRLTNGTVFDSSFERGQPAEFPLNGVIGGWTEGLQLMAEGGCMTFVIPPALGYGDQGVQGTIPPNATLIFDVQLLNILG